MKILLLVLCGVALLLLVLLLVYEIFFKKNFVYKVSYYTTEDKDFAMERKLEVEDIVKVSKVDNETSEKEEIKITKIILVKERKFASFENAEVAAKMESYNIKKIEYRSSQAKLVGEYGSEDSKTKFSSIIVTKKKQ